MKLFSILIALLIFPLQLLALEAPPLTGRINDLAGLLSPEVSQRLERKLAAFEQETSNQVAVLTVPSLKGDDIDQFAIRVADSWKLGQKGKDNGVLMILAQGERKVRIEVGMGLQGVLPDITASRIIRDTMRPYLRTNNFDQGITAGIDAIIEATKGEFKGSAEQPARRSSKRPSKSNIILPVIVAVAALGLFSRYLGGAAGAIGLPLAVATVFPGLGMFTLLLLAVAGLVAGFLLSILVSGLMGSGGGYYGGWGGGFYGGGGGSFGGGDSFSGGGGGFDGGGSSDDF